MKTEEVCFAETSVSAYKTTRRHDSKDHCRHKLVIYAILSPRCRTKWKRQTAVGLELLAEAGNYAAFQRLYGGPPYGCWPYPGAAPGPVPVAPSTADLYYRQAAAAAAAVSTLQKPLPYRLYPGAGIGLGLPGPSTAPVSTGLGSLSSYYNSHRSPQSPPQSPPPVTRPSSEEEDSPPRV